jgi:hypothetical protein
MEKFKCRNCGAELDLRQAKNGFITCGECKKIYILSKPFAAALEAKKAREQRAEIDRAFYQTARVEGTVLKKYRGNQTEVAVPNGITSIGDSAFADCSRLTSVTLPNSVTSIGMYAFNHCCNLTEITLPNSVTSIGMYAFVNCCRLTEIVIPASVMSVGKYAFNDCCNLTKIEVEKENRMYSSEDGVLFNRSKTVLIRYPAGKQGPYRIPDSVTEIAADAFADCGKLTELVIPDGVKEIGKRAFNDCSRLTGIEVDGYNRLYSSKSGVLFNKERTVLIQYPAGRQGGYKIPDTVTEIGENAFANCGNLTDITISDGVREIGGADFDDCGRLSRIEVGEGNRLYSSKNGVLFNKERTVLIRYPAGKEGEYKIPFGVREIEEDAFANCTRLTGVTIPNSVQEIEEGAFFNCSGLVEVEIPFGVTEIGMYAFADCGNLTSVEIPNSVREIEENTFVNCNSLTEISIPSGVREIGMEAFSHCGRLREITIPNSVTSIGMYAFANCGSLSEITIPRSVTEIEDGAFANCCALTDVEVEKGNRVYSSKNGVLFDKNQTVLLQYPAGRQGEYKIPFGVTEVGNYAFYHCSRLTGITIPNSVREIGMEAFNYCIHLADVVVPESVTWIGKSAFGNCPSANVTLPVGIADGRKSA